VNDCEEALRLDKAMVKLQVRRGRALLRLGFLAPAEDAFREVLNAEVRDLLSHRELQDPDLVANTKASLEGNKSNAQLGIKDATKIREWIRVLTVMEGQSKFKEALKVCEDILKLSPYYRVAHVSKAAAMCELLQYDECKAFIDELTTSTHGSIQSMHAHPSAVFPTCAVNNLSWKESTADKCVRADLPATIAFLLCTGAELGAVYLTALKNITPNRSYSADVMGKLGTLLRGLACKLAQDDLRGDWSWVQEESDKINCLLALKASADEKFKSKNFAAAKLAYTNALKVRVCGSGYSVLTQLMGMFPSSQIDPSARKWNAILHSNRAAAHMSLGMHSDAVQDCNQAIQKDPDFAKAFLRRARAYRVRYCC
jgi:tetratricopeptide (TPR) repeat protein